MIKWLFIFSIFAGGLSAQTTAVRFDPIPVLTVAGNVTSTSQYPPVLAIPFAQVSVCTYPSNAVPCTNLATTYTDATELTACPSYAQVVLATTAACTGTTDGLGNFGFWIASGTYSYTVTFGGVSYGPYYFTAGGAGGGGGGGGQFTSLLNFGCDPTGVLPINTCFATAQAAVAASGTQLYAPAGIYSVSAPGLTINTALQLSCDDGTIFKAAGNMSPAMINVTGNNARIDNCILDGGETAHAYTGAQLNIQGNNWHSDHLIFQNAAGIPMTIGGGSPTDGVYLQNAYMNGTQVGNATATGISITHGTHHVYVDWLYFVDSPAGGQDAISVKDFSATAPDIQDIFVTHSYFNISTSAFAIEAGNFANFNEISQVIITNFGSGCTGTLTATVNSGGAVVSGVTLRGGGLNTTTFSNLGSYANGVAQPTITYAGSCTVLPTAVLQLREHPAYVKNVVGADNVIDINGNLQNVTGCSGTALSQTLTCTGANFGHEASLQHINIAGAGDGGGTLGDTVITAVISPTVVTINRPIVVTVTNTTATLFWIPFGTLSFGQNTEGGGFWRNKLNVLTGAGCGPSSFIEASNSIYNATIKDNVAKIFPPGTASLSELCGVLVNGASNSLIDNNTVDFVAVVTESNNYPGSAYDVISNNHVGGLSVSLNGGSNLGATINNITFRDNTVACGGFVAGVLSSDCSTGTAVFISNFRQETAFTGVGLQGVNGIDIEGNSIVGNWAVGIGNQNPITNVRACGNTYDQQIANQVALAATSSCDQASLWITPGIQLRESVTYTPPAPTLTAGTLAGSLTNGTTYYYIYFGISNLLTVTPNNGFYGFGGTLPSPEASFTATSSGSINIAVPPIVGALAYGVCRVTTTGTEVNCMTIPTPNYTDTGTNTQWLNKTVASGNFAPTRLTADGSQNFIVGQPMATENGRDPLSDGLVLDLPTNEGSGSIAVDRIFGINYTVSSAWIQTGGKFGPFVAAHKNYNNGNVRTGYANLQLSGLQEFTVSVWAQSNGSTSAALPGDLVYHGRDYGSVIEFILGVQSTSTMFLDVGTTATGPGSPTVCTSSTLPNGPWTDTNWHLFTATYSQTSGNAVLYEDGIYTGTTCSIPGHINQAEGDNGDLATGLGDAATVNVGANANVTGLRIWNRALSADEITTLYQRFPTGALASQPTPPTTFALLGACNTLNFGSLKPISDSTTTTWGATITGGSTGHVLAFCDGTNWTVMAQ